jgi:hypothetical protein
MEQGIEPVHSAYEVKASCHLGSPSTLFDDASVYLFVDLDNMKFWIWSGERSPLFNTDFAKKTAITFNQKPMFRYFTIENVIPGFEPAEFKFFIRKLGEIEPHIGISDDFFTNDAEVETSKDLEPDCHDHQYKKTDRGNTLEILNGAGNILEIFQKIRMIQERLSILYDQLDIKILGFEYGLDINPAESGLNEVNDT